MQNKTLKNVSSLPLLQMLFSTKLCDVIQMPCIFFSQNCTYILQKTLQSFQLHNCLAFCDPKAHSVIQTLHLKLLVFYCIYFPYLVRIYLCVMATNCAWITIVGAVGKRIVRHFLMPTCCSSHKALLGCGLGSAGDTYSEVLSGETAARVMTPIALHSPGPRCVLKRTIPLLKREIAF